MFALAVLLALAPDAFARSTGSESLDEIGSQLRPLMAGSDTAISVARRADITVSRAERVLIQVYVEQSSDDSTEQLRRTGMHVTATAREPVAMAEGWIPATGIIDLARLESVRAVTPVTGGGSDVGSVLSQGVAAHRIPEAVLAGAGTGTGVDVGVISTSLNQVNGGIADSQATGDLPPGQKVVVLKDGNSPNDDEGRAMAEIIYDGAPGINKLVFASGTNAGPVDKADSINRLVESGVDVIADDIFWLSEPFFQDGVVSQAVDAARAAGVTYIASAGNRARQSYEASYRNAVGFHDFDPGGAVDTTQTLATVANNAFISITMNWDEPWGVAQTDLDLLLKQADGSDLPCGPPVGGQDDNLAIGNPSEIVFWQNTCGFPGPVGLKIERFAGAASPFMKYIARGNFGPFAIGEHATNSDAINPDAAAARGAITVGAVNHGDPGLDTPELFSSRGPTTRLFDRNGLRLAVPEVRSKPEVAAADGVSTTVPGFLQFLGTSAAVPSAAGIAASLISTNPEASPDEIRAQLTNPGNSVDCTSSLLVPDPDCGAGFLLADNAAASLDLTGPVVSPSLTPSVSNGSNGWFTTPVGLAWTSTDPESPVESSPCPMISDSSDGIETFGCDARSGGGSSSASIEIKLDKAGPSLPKITGIKARKYTLRGRGKLPPLGRIKCRSSDSTSGLASCRITGYKRKAGKRTLVARAIDNAGLASVSRLSYRVVRNQVR